MVFLFKNNDKLYLITLPLFVLLCFFAGLYGLQSIGADSCSSLKLNFPGSPFILKTLLLISLLSSAFYLNHIVQKHEITEKQNHFPGVLFALSSSVFLHSEELFPLIFSGVFFLVAIDNFLSIYREESSGPKVFNGSFFLGTSILISPAFCFFLLIPFIALLLFKPFKLREWVFALIGILIPGVFQAFYFFVEDISLQVAIFPILRFFQDIHYPVVHNGSTFFLIVCSLLFLISIAGLSLRKQVRKIKSQKARSVIIWIFIFSLADLFFSVKSNLLIISISTLPFSVFVGDYLGTMKNNSGASFLFLIFLSAFFYLCFF